MSDTNAGPGMVPHKAGCRCDECEIDRLRARVRELEQQISWRRAEDGFPEIRQGVLNVFPTDGGPFGYPGAVGDRYLACADEIKALREELREIWGMLENAASHGGPCRPEGYTDLRTKYGRDKP